MTEHVLKQQPQGVASLRLIPSSGGVFEVTANGRVVFSKKKAGRRPEPDEILEALFPGRS